MAIPLGLELHFRNKIKITYITMFRANWANSINRHHLLYRREHVHISLRLHNVAYICIKFLNVSYFKLT